MTWNYAALWAKELLGLALIARLLMLRLHRVYYVFCIFLGYELLGAVFAILLRNSGLKVDYRLVWLVLSPVSWILTLWMVYALLQAVLARLPGILKFSRRLLNVVSVGAVIASVISGQLEFASGIPSSYRNVVLSRAVAAGFIFERVVFTIALIVLLAIVSFVLWFPVEIPRNLILFCFGLVVYLSSRNAVLLAAAIWGDKVTWLGAVSTLILAACCVYWAVCISPEGEYPLRMARHERPDEHERLVRQLETMNAALLRGVRN